MPVIKGESCGGICAIRGRSSPFLPTKVLDTPVKGFNTPDNFSGIKRCGGMMKSLASRLLCLLLVVLFCFSLLWSQGSTAQITGSVSDPTGAVLPGVEITATQTETGVSRTAISNEAGAYVLPNL